MNSVTIATGFTPDYAVYKDRLERSCRAFDVPFRAVPLESRGLWRRNNALKPSVIRSVMLAIEGDCLWLDADCILTKRPELGDIRADVSFTSTRHWRGGRIVKVPDPETFFNFETGREEPNEGGRVVTPWAGWLLCRYSEGVLEMLAKWELLCEQYEDITGDEQCLRLALEFSPGVSTGELLNDFADHVPVGRSHGKPNGYI